MKRLLLATPIVFGSVLFSAQAVAKPADGYKVCSAIQEIVVPAYPPDARAAGAQGDVLIRITVGGDGKVLTSDVVSGEPVLAEPARLAATQWSFGKTSQASSIPKEAELLFRYVLTPGVTRLAIEDKRLTVWVPASVTDPALLDAGRTISFFGEKRPQPPFPRGVQPTNEVAVIDVEVTEAGQVQSVRSDPGDRSFRSEAEHATRGWTFREVHLNGRRVRLKGQVVFNWSVG